MSRRQLLRQRWQVRGVLAVSVAASLGANVAHAEPSVMARVVAGWAPAALFVAIELLTRIQTTAGTWRRWVGTGAAGVIAAIAAWVSYWHMAAICSRVGEDPIAAHIIPLSVDGLVVVASVLLVELEIRIAFARADSVLAAGLASGRTMPVDPATEVIEQPARVIVTPPDPAARVTAPVEVTAPALVDPVETIRPAGEVTVTPDDPVNDPDRDEKIPDPDPLLKVARTIPGHESMPWDVLIRELRNRDQKCGTTRAQKLVKLLRAESQNGQVMTRL